MLKILIDMAEPGGYPGSKTLVKIPEGTAVWFSSYDNPQGNPFRSGGVFIFRGMARDASGNSVALFGPMPISQQKVEARMGLYVAEPLDGIVQPEIKRG